MLSVKDPSTETLSNQPSDMRPSEGAANQGQKSNESKMFQQELQNAQKELNSPSTNTNANNLQNTDQSSPTAQPNNPVAGQPAEADAMQTADAEAEAVANIDEILSGDETTVAEPELAKTVEINQQTASEKVVAARNDFSQLASTEKGRDDIGFALTGKEREARSAEDNAKIDQFISETIANNQLGDVEVSTVAQASAEQIENGEVANAIPEGVAGAAFVDETGKGNILLADNQVEGIIDDVAAAEVGEIIGERAKAAGIQVADGDVGDRFVLAKNDINHDSRLFEGTFTPDETDTVKVAANGTVVEAKADPQFHRMVAQTRQALQRARQGVANGRYRSLIQGMEREGVFPRITNTFNDWMARRGRRILGMPNIPGRGFTDAIDNNRIAALHQDIVAMLDGQLGHAVQNADAIIAEAENRRPFLTRDVIVDNAGSTTVTLALIAAGLANAGLTAGAGFTLGGAAITAGVNYGGRLANVIRNYFDNAPQLAQNIINANNAMIRYTESARGSIDANAFVGAPREFRDADFLRLDERVNQATGIVETVINLERTDDLQRAVQNFVGGGSGPG